MIIEHFRAVEKDYWHFPWERQRYLQGRRWEHCWGGSFRSCSQEDEA